jgi:hypothetical protein
MSGLSKCLNSSTSRLLKSSLLYLNKPCSSAGNTLLKSSNLSNQLLMAPQARASHGRTMFIRPGKFYTKKFFDMVVSSFLTSWRLFSESFGLIIFKQKHIKAF